MPATVPRRCPSTGARFERQLSTSRKDIADQHPEHLSVPFLGEGRELGSQSPPRGCQATPRTSSGTIVPNAHVFTAFGNSAIASMSHCEQDLTHHATCSARSKMLRARSLVLLFKVFVFLRFPATTVLKLHRRDAAVDTQLCSGRKFRLVRGVIQGGRRDFFRFSRPAEGPIGHHLPEARDLFRT
jgi:hypothetical protein